MLVVVSGPPGTGKTTLGKRLAEHLDLPFVNKDGIKETLYDTLGIGDREFSRRLGIASYRLLYYFIEVILKTGNSLVAESNFQAEHDAGKLQKLADAYGCRTVQIQCRADGEVLLERYKKRDESGQRHPGHVENPNYAEIEVDLLRGYYRPLDLDGEIIYIDTTDFARVDYNRLFDKVARLMQA